MTLYTGQGLTQVNPIRGESSNPDLLFTERDRREAYRYITHKEDIRSANHIVSRLITVAEANNSHQANFLLEQLCSIAQVEGVDIRINEEAPGAIE